MNIQRFVAPTAREALAKARAVFGDDTLILSNRQLPDGVEVMAATEAALAMIEGGSHAAPAPVPAPQPVTIAPVPAPALDIGVEADTEQLAMSTLSFQDYVRERMLRRQHEAAAPATHAVPATPPAAAMPERAPEPAPMPMPKAAPVVAVAVTPREIAPEPAAVASVPASLPTPQAEPFQASQAQAGVMAELQSMKDMMDERFAALAWLGYARQDPIQSNLMLKLVRAGYSPTLSRAVLESMPQGLEAVDAVRWLMEALESRLGNFAPLPSIPQEGGVFALIGATGVGKTTTAAKLAAMSVQLHGAAGVGLITLDTQRAGAHEQLRAHGRSLGVVAHLAHDRAALIDLLNLLAGKKVVIIDSAGVAPHDPRRRELLDMLDIPCIKRVLVLNAGAHGDTLEDIAIAFKIGGTRQAIVSKLDEAAKIGPVLDTLMRHEFTVRGISNGQRVPEDWKTGDARGLVRASMQASQRSAFDPKTADLPCYFSPAGTGA